MPVSGASCALPEAIASPMTAEPALATTMTASSCPAVSVCTSCSCVADMLGAIPAASQSARPIVPDPLSLGPIPTRPLSPPPGLAVST